MKNLPIYLSMLFLSVMHLSIGQEIQIYVKNIKPSTKGVIRLAFFKSEADYKAEKVTLSIYKSKDDIQDGILSLKVDLSPGVYGICVLDDENSNGKMDYRLLFFPRESFGFSNYKLRKMKKPKFQQFSFKVVDGESQEVVIPMKNVGD